MTTAAATPPAPASRDLRQELAQAQQDLAAAQAANDRAAYLAALERQAQALLDSGDAKAAASLYNLLLKFYRNATASAPDDTHRIAQGLGGLAQCDLLRGNLDTASAGIKQALDANRSARDPALEARLLACQGRILIEQEQFQLAAGVLQQSSDRRPPGAPRFGRRPGAAWPGAPGPRDKRSGAGATAGAASPASRAGRQGPRRPDRSPVPGR